MFAKLSLKKREKKLWHSSLFSPCVLFLMSSHVQKWNQSFFSLDFFSRCYSLYLKTKTNDSYIFKITLAVAKIFENTRLNKNRGENLGNVAHEESKIPSWDWDPGFDWKKLLIHSLAPHTLQNINECSHKHSSLPMKVYIYVKCVRF